MSTIKVKSKKPEKINQNISTQLFGYKKIVNEIIKSCGFCVIFYHDYYWWWIKKIEISQRDTHNIVAVLKLLPWVIMMNWRQFYRHWELNTMFFVFHFILLNWRLMQQNGRLNMFYPKICTGSNSLTEIASFWFWLLLSFVCLCVRVYLVFNSSLVEKFNSFSNFGNLHRRY